mgnify:FL=1|jgi:hypothetical protein
MPAIQLERLKNDIMLLEAYIRKLTKRGHLDRVTKLLEKKTFLEERLAHI